MRVTIKGSPHAGKDLVSTYSMWYAIQPGALGSPTILSPKSIISGTHYSISQNGLIIWFSFKELGGKKTPQDTILLYIKNDVI